MIDQRGGRGFTIRTSDTYHLGIGITACELYFADDVDSFLVGLLDHGSSLRDTRTLDNLLGIQNLLFCMLAFFPFDLVVI